MVIPQIEGGQVAGGFPLPVAADITGLCRAEGPCVSIFLSPYRVGTGSQPSRTKLKNAIPEIAAALGKSQDAAYIVESLEAMSDAPALLDEHDYALCIYQAPREVHFFSVETAIQTSWHVEDHFVMTPLLAHLHDRKNFLMLALAAKHLRLSRYEAGKFVPIPFPAGVPESQAEFIGEADAGAGKFETPPPRANNPHFLTDFMKAVDRGLQPILRAEALPLVLVGVDEETAAYATVTEYPDLVNENIRMSADGGITATELAAAGAEIVARWISPAERQALAGFEKVGLTRRSTDPEEILKAAAKGKVNHLFIQRGAAAREINSAIGQVLLHRGNVWLLPPEHVPEAVPMAAIMRYAEEK